MYRKLLYLAVIVLVGSMPICLRAADVVDRIVATVNGHPVLQSDWDEAVAYEAFADARPRGSSTPEQRKAALDRLIDQELIRQQRAHTGFQQASSQEVARRIQEIRNLHPEAGSEAGWQTALQRYGITESELRDKVVGELDEMRAVDAHLRPGIQIDARSIEAYYHDKLLPELRQKGAAEVPLEQVTPKIRELLAQQKMNDLLITWIRTLRSESDIRIPSTGSGRAGGGGH